MDGFSPTAPSWNGPAGARERPVEPAESPFFTEGRSGGHRIEGIGLGYLPPPWESALASEYMTVVPQASGRKAPSDCASRGAVPRSRFGCGEGIRTLDLRVMSPTSCRCSTPRPRMVRAVRATVKRRTALLRPDPVGLP